MGTILSELASVCSPQKGPVATAGFLASLQETCGLSAIGLAELKALVALERTLSPTSEACYLPFALAAFLLDESGLKKGIAAGIFDAPESWITVARVCNVDQHSYPYPKKHPEVPPNIVRALEHAEHVRRFWLMGDDDLNWLSKRAIEGRSRPRP